MGSPVRRHNLVSATPPTVFKRFWWNFPVYVPMTWRWSYFIEVMLYWFLPELQPFGNFSAVSLVCNSSCNFQWILVKPSSYCCHDLQRIILYWGHDWPLFTRVMALCQFKSFISRSSCLRNSYISQGNFPVMFPWSDDNHILSRSCSMHSTWIIWRSFFSVNCSLQDLGKLKKWVCWKGCKISKHCLGHICYRNIHHKLTFQTLGDTWLEAFYWTNVNGTRERPLLWSQITRGRNW